MTKKKDYYLVHDQSPDPDAVCVTKVTGRWESKTVKFLLEKNAERRGLEAEISIHSTVEEAITALADALRKKE